MTASLSGPWHLPQIEAFMSRSKIPMRLACVGKDGFPRVVSVWFRYTDGSLQCVTHKDSHLANTLRDNARVGFEIAPNDPPYHGVRGRGTTTLAPLGSATVLEELLAHYLGGQDSRVGNWLLSRKEEELLVTVQPLNLFSWDYRERMADVADRD